jgi:hypothetical protein
MARIGHDSERATMIYQHKARGADKNITNATDTHVQAAKRDDDDSAAGVLAPATWASTLKGCSSVLTVIQGAIT